MRRLSYPLGVLLVLVLMHGLTMPPVTAQMAWPLQGQNLPPPGITAIHTDVVMDTIQAINSDRNSWNAIHWVHLSWVDPRADQAIQAATKAWALASVNSSFTASGGCSKYCDSSMHPTAGCCDRLWLPHVDGNNLVSLSQEANYRWSIWVDPPTAAPNTTGTTALGAAGITTNSTVPTNSTASGNSTRMVHWVVRITAEWQSPFDFRAWPFEHQHLLMELSIASSLADKAYLQVNKFALVEHTPTHKGDNVPGWHVAKMTRRMFDSSGCFNTSQTITLYEVSDDSSSTAVVGLKPLNPQSWAYLQHNTTSPDGLTLVTKNTYQCPPPGTFSAESTAQYGPQIVVMDVMVRRTQLYYILSNILPLLLLDYMVFITYAMERSDLESRMGVVVTLVLSVSALQFTYSFPPASYLNAVQQITLMSYCLYFIVAIQSMVTSHICRLHARKRNYERLKSLSRPRRENSMSIDGRAVIGAPVLEPITSGIAGLGRFKHSEKEDESCDDDARPSLSYAAAAPPTPGGGSSAHNPAAAKALRSQLYAMSDTGSKDGGPKSGGHLSVTMPRGPGPVAEGLNSDNEIGYSPAANGGKECAKKDKSGFACGRCFSCFKKRPAPMSDPSELSIQGDRSSIGAKPQKRMSFDARTLQRVGSSIAGAAHKTRHMTKRIDADEAFAQLVAARLDQIFSWTLLVCFTVVVAVLLYINQQVGDHKMMLSGAPPANM